MDPTKTIDLRNIQPVTERRTPEKGTAGDKPAGEAFNKILDSVQKPIEPRSPPGQGSIEDRFDRLAKEVDIQAQKIQETLEQQRLLLNKNTAGLAVRIDATKAKLTDKEG